MDKSQEEWCRSLASKWQNNWKLKHIFKLVCNSISDDYDGQCDEHENDNNGNDSGDDEDDGEGDDNDNEDGDDNDSDAKDVDDVMMTIMTKMKIQKTLMIDIVMTKRWW